MDIKALSQLGVVSKEIEITSKFKVKIRTLSTVEQHEALTAIPGGLTSDVSNFPKMQIAVLTQATTEVNGEKVSKEDATELYKSLQYSITAKIFTEYSLLADEQVKVLDELKKK